MNLLTYRISTVPYNIEYCNSLQRAQKILATDSTTSFQTRFKM